MDYTKDIEIKQEIARVTDLGNKIMTYRAALTKRLESLENAKAEEITQLTELSSVVKASVEALKQAGMEK